MQIDVSKIPLSTIPFLVSRPPQSNTLTTVPSPRLARLSTSSAGTMTMPLSTKSSPRSTPTWNPCCDHPSIHLFLWWWRREIWFCSDLFAFLDAVIICLRFLDLVMISSYFLDFVIICLHFELFYLGFDEPFMFYQRLRR